MPCSFTLLFPTTLSRNIRVLNNWNMTGSGCDSDLGLQRLHVYNANWPLLVPPNFEKTSRHFLLGSLYQHFLTSLSLPAGPRKTLQKFPFWLTVLALADADLFSLVWTWELFCQLETVNTCSHFWNSNLRQKFIFYSESSLALPFWLKVPIKCLNEDNWRTTGKSFMILNKTPLLCQ